MKSVVISFHYCTKCKWMLRTVWMAQELLSTFDGEISEIRLLPTDGGVFKILVNETLIWDRERDGGFPDVKELKQKTRDIMNPTKDLGHIDR